MESMGLLKVVIVRRKSLTIRDSFSGDPYVLVKLGQQKAKTKVIKRCLNPVWNEELSFTLSEPDEILNFEVFNRYIFKADDKMGHASLKLQPKQSATRLRQILQVSAGETPLRKVVPDSDDSLVCESNIIFKDGEVVQNAQLRISSVESGEIEVKMKYIESPTKL